MRALRIPSRVRMLEVGCGRGIALPALARRCDPARLVGLDVDAALVDEARARVGTKGVRCEVVCGDVRALPFDAETFDVVVDFGTLFHIARSEDAIREIARVLVPGGLLVHETKLAQLLSHPVRSRGRAIPWRAVPHLRPRSWAGLWAARVRDEVSGTAA